MKRQDPAHLAFVRSQGCILRETRGHQCFGPIEAHHVRTAANSGVGLKPPDSASVGLCARHHRALHMAGRRTFEATFNVDLIAESERLAKADAGSVEAWQ